RFAPGGEALGRGPPAGGAVYASGVPVGLINVDVVDSVVIDRGSGGGFACQNCTITATALTVERSRARFGAGVSWFGGRATLTEPTFSDNGTDGETQFGGGVLAVGVDLALIDPVVTQNRARRGGGLAVFGLSDAMVSRGLISGNEAEHGAGILAGVQRLTLDGTEVMLNRASDLGGGLAVADGYEVEDEAVVLIDPALVLDGATIEGNTARDGGGLWATGVGVGVSQGTIERNMARETGGGLHLERGSLELRDASILDNLAGVDGGGVATWASQVQVWDNTFARNESGQGAALLIHGSAGAQVVRNRICGNVSSDHGIVTLVGDGAPSDTGGASLSNNLIVSTARSNSSAVVLQEAAATVHHNNFVGWQGFAVDADNADLNLHHNLVQWGTQGPMIRHEGRSVQAESNLFWRAGDVDVIGIDGSGTPWLDKSDARVQHPHLRGYLRGGAPLEAADACQWSAHHPRPTSPLLAATSEADVVGPSPDHVGVFGGQNTPVLPWRTDQDQDQAKLIFDCDDSMSSIGDRLAQYIDADGDGLGAEVWGGDECVPVPGARPDGGDCDDSNPEIGAECPEAIRYYGRTCSSSGESAAGALAVLLLLGLTRRRRFLR
ncbi:MAG: MYXO-CTERM sorting domain-containing protein, partial [Myxococcota bacterium]